MKVNTTDRWHCLRRPVQLVALVLFLALFAAGRRPELPLPADLFIRLDPLAGLSSALAGRTIPTRFAPALVLVAGTLLLGRAWCGWLCPLGTALDLAGGPHPRNGRLKSSLQTPRFLILFALLAAALLANQSLLILDPNTLLTRALGTLLMSGQWGLSVWQAWSHDQALPVAPQPYLPGLLALALLAAVLALNRFGHRFWCRVLCPLGALLGLMARVGWLRRRVDQGCSACRLCARECPMATPDPECAFASDPAGCIVCLTCQTRCPEGVVTFQGKWHWNRRQQGYDPGRRQVLASLVVGGLGAWLLRSWPASGQRSPWLIRPPGAREADLLNRCIRCGECVKVCPTVGLQPIVLESGWEGLWTPALIARLGWCSYDCNLCGQVCPTGAIPRLTLEEKRRAVMGIVRIDRDRCIPWAHLRVCTVCYDTCPLPEKAIELEKTEAVDELGQKLIIRRPHVLEELCIGCGVCEYNCPVAGEAAIRVYAPDAPG